MAAGNVARIIRAPGNIVVNPTNLAAAYPYGGTEVGKTNQCALQPMGSSFRVEYEGFREAGDILEGDNRYTFGCFLRGWDDDAVQKLLAGGYEAGSVTQHSVFHEPGNQVPGESALTRSVILLYVPDDLIHVPAVLIYNGVPDWTEGADLAFQRGDELGIPITLDCLRDSNNNMLRVGRFADLALS